ncbi:MAG: glycosyltransferase family 1 protein [Acidobacteriota bacterium]
MKIAVDGYELGKEARGVGRVIHNLLLELFSLRLEDEFVIYTKEDIGAYNRPRAHEVVLAARRGYLRWQNGPLRQALQKLRADIFIASNYILPLFPPARSILFEHDISVVSHPSWYPRRYALTRRYLTRRSLRLAAAVVVSSEFVKMEILSRFNLPPGKIRVISYGVEEKFRPAQAEDIRLWRKKKNLEEKKVVGYLGSIFKRRHIPLLVRAVELLRRENPAVVLYLVGKDFGALDDPAVARLLNESWVRWEQTLPEEELPLFYSGLDVFAYLSEYEGFGFPPLEALACGVPVVVLDRSSLREIFCGLGIMVDQPDEKEVAAALRTALMDEATKVRMRLEFEKARSRLSWKRAAAELSELFESLD